jgi:hypothetical protein
VGRVITTFTQAPGSIFFALFLYVLVPGGTANWSVTNAKYDDQSDSVQIAIEKAPLTVTAENQEKKYGEPNPALTASYSGFVSGQVPATSGVTGTPLLTTSATPASSVGPYDINVAPGTLQAANYSFTFVKGMLTVSELPVQLSGARPFDDTNTAQAAILGITNKVGSDSVFLSTGTATLESKDVGLRNITSTGNLVLGGEAAGNYTLTGASGSVAIGAWDANERGFYQPVGVSNSKFVAAGSESLPTAPSSGMAWNAAKGGSTIR